MSPLFSQPPTYPTMAFVDRRARRTRAQRWAMGAFGGVAAIGMAVNAWVAWVVGDLVAALSGLLLLAIGVPLWRSTLREAAFAWAVRQAPHDAMAAHMAQALRPLILDTQDIHHGTPMCAFWLTEWDGLRLASLRVGGEEAIETNPLRQPLVPYPHHRLLWRLVAVGHRTKRLVLMIDSLLATDVSAHQRLHLVQATPHLLPLPTSAHTPQVAHG